MCLRGKHRAPFKCRHQLHGRAFRHHYAPKTVAWLRHAGDKFAFRARSCVCVRRSLRANVSVIKINERTSRTHLESGRARHARATDDNAMTNPFICTCRRACASYTLIFIAYARLNALSQAAGAATGGLARYSRKPLEDLRTARTAFDWAGRAGERRAVFIVCKTRPTLA